MIDEAFPRATVTWGEKEIRFGRPTLKAQAAFKEELERAALAAILRKSDMLSAGQLAEAIAALGNLCGAKRIYAWGKKDWAEAIQDVENFKRMLWHVLVQQVLPEKQSLNPWLTPDMMDRLWDDLAYTGDDGSSRNRLDDAYATLMAPDPNAKPPTGTPSQAAATS